jgi:cytochrome P450
LGVERAFAITPTDDELPDEPDEVLRRILDPVTRGELYPLYHRLRALAPVHRASVPGLPDGCWVLTSYAAADRVARAVSAVNDPRTAAVFDHDGRGGAFFRLMSNAMLFLEKPEHDRIRRLVFRAFTPRAVAHLGGLTETVATELLDAVADDGEMDFVTSFAYPLPIRAICQLLGIPPTLQTEIERWTWDFARAGDPMSRTAELAARGDTAAVAFHDVFDDLLADRRAHPRDDVMTVLASSDDNGERLSSEEAIATCVLLLQAGHETTADLLGNGLIGLFRHPHELAWLRANPDQTRGAVEELLRYDCSVQMSMRLITEDLVVEGTSIPAGSLAGLVYGAANRDPARFPDPDRLDVRRNPMHLAFSAGAYHCIGNALARVELTAGLRTVLARLPGLAPASESFLHRRSMRMRGPLQLPVRWDRTD